MPAVDPPGSSMQSMHPSRKNVESDALVQQSRSNRDRQESPSPDRLTLVGGSFISPIAKMEHAIADLLNQGHSLHDQVETSSILSTQRTLNSMEKYSEEVTQHIEAIGKKNRDMANHLQSRLGPHTQMQATSELIKWLDAKFRSWENSEVQDNTNLKLKAAALFRGHSEGTAKSLLHGSIALKQVPGRSDVQFGMGWNAISNITHHAFQFGAMATSFAPPAAATLKFFDSMLGIYSKFRSDQMNDALSPLLEHDQIEPFCKDFSRGAALMMMHKLGEKSLVIT